MKPTPVEKYSNAWVSPTLHASLTISGDADLMSWYRRLYVPGGTYFFTVALADRKAQVLVDEIELLRSVYASVIAEHPVRCDAMVVLPDHIHAVWTLPEDDADFSIRWKKIKGVFSRHCKAKGRITPSKLRRGEKGIWQRRFWEHSIRDNADYRMHLDYCHFNPVKHGLVERPEDWPYSTVHRDMREGRHVA